MFQLNDHVSEEGLRNLKYYKYASIDKSPIANYILKHYWNYAITLFPLWIAPNLITLIGFVFVVFNFLLALYYIPNLTATEDSPSWIFFSFAVGLWLYSTFDNVDGKQARRTGTSSPLGELFDHGVDALNCTFGALVQAAGLGLGYSWYTALLVFLTITAFFFSTWETYHTGVLYLGYINGPTEGLILACTLLTLSGVWGPGVWMNEAFNGFSYVDLFLGGMIVLLFTTQIPVSLWRVYQATKLKGKSFSEALLHIAPFCAFLGSMYTWLKAPHSSVVEQNVVLFSCCVGIVFGRVSTKIILAHVTKMEYPMFTVLMFPLFIGSLIANSPELFGTDIIFTAKLEEYYLMVYLFFAIVVYLHWTFVVVESFCDYLDIWCLRIKPKKVEDKGVRGSPRKHNNKLE